MVNMKKLKSYIILFFILLISIVYPGNTVEANSIEELFISVEIQEDGSAIFRDQRVINADQGTEHYISLGNLGDSEILDFKVYDENGKELEKVDNWDIDASLEEKSGKYGINRNGNEIELCYGIGKYGTVNFTAEYKITNFIRNLEDGNQVFYWTFLNQNMDKINYSVVEIINTKGYKYEYPNTKFWFFGYEGGDADITEEKLIARTHSDFNSSDYMTLLGYFDGKVFETTGSFEYTFDELLDMATSGSTINDNEYNSNSYGLRIQEFYPFIIPFLFIFIGLFRARNKSSKKISNIVNTKDVDYYRDTPNMKFYDTQYMMDTDVSNMISSYIIKWINEGRLKDDVEETGFIFKKDQLALKIIDDNIENIKNINERQLWDMVIKASEGDGLLTQKEFKRYVKNNHKGFGRWIDSIERNSKTKLENEGYLEIQKQKFLFIPYDKLGYSDKGKTLYKNIIGFKKYLQDFSLLNERGMSESALWQDYMVWASYLGIAEEVYKQFEIVDPTIVETMPYNMNTIYYTRAFSNSVSNTYSSQVRQQASSGGGGMSFGGGGGGSFGGGSGGGTR